VARNYKVISADSHLDLDPAVWVHHVPARWRERAPKRIVMPNGADALQSDNGEVDTIGITRNVGVPFEDLPRLVPKFSEPVGNGTPELRLQEQDRDGIDAEVMFTWADQMFRDTDDDELYRVLVHAYNEYLGREYMAVAPDRLLPQGTIPTTGIDDAVKELEHCARVGLKGVTLTRFPSGRGYPTPDDDRFWAAALDLNMALARHGGGPFSGQKGDPIFQYPRQNTSTDLHKRDAITLLFSNMGGQQPCGALQMAYAGVWDRFPRLKMYFAETMAGWIPFALFMVDDNYKRYQPIMRAFWGVDDLERRPSEYLREHTYWGTLYDVPGAENCDAIGADHIMFCTDFPHAAGDWPNSGQVIEDMFAGVPQDKKQKMLVENAVTYWHLDD